MTSRRVLTIAFSLMMVLLVATPFAALGEGLDDDTRSELSSNAMSIVDPSDSEEFIELGAGAYILSGQASVNYSTIQDAIEASTPGQTVNIYPGGYNETLTINKSVKLSGSGVNSTRFVAPMDSAVIRVQAANVTIDNLSIERGFLGLSIENSTNVSVLDCHISLSEGTSWGVWIYNSSNVSMERSIVALNFGGGILAQNSTGTTVTHTIITLNRFGFQSYGSFGSRVSNCTFNYNMGYDIGSFNGERLAAGYNWWVNILGSDDHTNLEGNVSIEPILDSDPTENPIPKVISPLPSDIVIEEGSINMDLMDMDDYFQDDFRFLYYEVEVNTQSEDIAIDVSLAGKFSIDARFLCLSGCADVDSDYHGVFQVVINITDVAGNHFLSNTFDITVTPVYEPPEITQWSMEDGDTYILGGYNGIYDDGTLSFRGTAGDDEELVSAQVRINGGAWEELGNRTSWNYIWTPTKAGDFLFEFRAYDGFNYTYAETINVTVEQAPAKDLLSSVGLEQFQMIMLGIIAAAAFALGLATRKAMARKSGKQENGLGNDGTGSDNEIEDGGSEPESKIVDDRPDPNNEMGDGEPEMEDEIMDGRLEPENEMMDDGLESDNPPIDNTPDDPIHGVDAPKEHEMGEPVPEGAGHERTDEKQFDAKLDGEEST